MVFFSVWIAVSEETQPVGPGGLRQLLTPQVYPPRCGFPHPLHAVHLLSDSSWCASWSASGLNPLQQHLKNTP